MPPEEEEEFEFPKEGEELRDPEAPGETKDDLAAGDQEVLEVEGKGKVVPLNVVQKIRDELKAEKEARARSEATIDILQRTRQEQGNVPAVDPVFGDLKDDDVLTVAEMKKVLGAVQAQNVQAISEVSTASQHPDYHKVVNKYLPGVLKDDPALTAAIRAAPNPYMLAYKLSKWSPEYIADRAKARALQKEGDDEEGGTEAEKRIRANLRKPSSALKAGSNIGGQSKVDAIVQMTDEDFEKHMQRVRRGGS